MASVFRAACAGVISASLAISALSAASTSYYMRELDLMSAEPLVQVREACALGRMPAILRKVQVDQPDEALPAPDAYCLRAISLSAKRGALLDLYMTMALEEQGYSGLHFTSQMQLLRHDEVGQTQVRILRAANDGAKTYEGIGGKVRELPCPLAFDAGYSFGYRYPEKPLPYTQTAEEAGAVAQACYQPAAPNIQLGATSVPAQKAGLVAGAFFGREQRLQAGSQADGQ